MNDIKECRTPVNKFLQKVRNTIEIPPSPLMQKLGYGTGKYFYQVTFLMNFSKTKKCFQNLGVAVYKMNRSPIQNKSRSPWALKKATSCHKHSEEINQRIKDEATVLRKLNHPNIIGFRAHITLKDGKSALAMEQCTTSLGDLIEGRFENNESMFSSNQILKVAKDVANALNYLHNVALILHCDVKSYNVLIKGDFEICKLCDFGVYLPLKSDGFVDTAKASEEVEYVGTLPWCPPEILCQDQIITDRADIYAYGLTIWEMLALTVPPMHDDSMLDSTMQSLDDSIIEIKTRERPDLPNVEFGDEYQFILSLFYVCTEEEYKNRPTAKDLLKILS